MALMSPEGWEARSRGRSAARARRVDPLLRAAKEQWDRDERRCRVPRVLLARCWPDRAKRPPGHRPLARPTLSAMGRAAPEPARRPCRRRSPSSRPAVGWRARRLLATGVPVALGPPCARPHRWRPKACARRAGALGVVVHRGVEDGPSGRHALSLARASCGALVAGGRPRVPAPPGRGARRRVPAPGERLAPDARRAAGGVPHMRPPASCLGRARTEARVAARRQPRRERRTRRIRAVLARIHESAGQPA
jgi:hypothetical protein